MGKRKIEFEYNEGKGDYQLEIAPRQVGDDGVSLMYGFSTNNHLAVNIIQGYHSNGMAHGGRACIFLELDEIKTLKKYIDDILEIEKEKNTPPPE